MKINTNQRRAYHAVIAQSVESTTPRDSIIGVGSNPTSYFFAKYVSIFIFLNIFNLLEDVLSCIIICRSHNQTMYDLHPGFYHTGVINATHHSCEGTV